MACRRMERLARIQSRRWKSGLIRGIGKVLRLEAKRFVLPETARSRGAVEEIACVQLDTCVSEVLADDRRSVPATLP